MDMRSNKVLSSIALSAMLVIMAMAAILPTTQAAWYDHRDTNITISPNDLLSGQTTTVTYTLDIGAENGVTRLDIDTVRVRYEWESSAVLLSGQQFNATEFPATLTFTRSVTVPASLAAGSYGVNITVNAFINGDETTSVSASHVFTGSVQVSDPLGAEVTATPINGTAPQEISFDVTASGGTGPYTYSWDFGDGSAASTQRNPKHNYTVGGNYTAKVTVTDKLGRSIVENAPTVAIAPGVTVVITAQPSAGPYPLVVKFTSTVTNYDGDLTYSWNFGDGGTSDEASPTHTYEEPGNYSASLTVTDSEDRTGVSNTLTIRVTRSVNPTATISASVDHGYGPLAVDFMSTVDGGVPPYTYLWNFGDGTTSTQANPSHTYTDPGVYLVRLTLTDSTSKQSVSAELTITVLSETSMTVIISTTEVTGSSPLTVSFNSTILNGTEPYFYRWSFGDGVNSTQANPTHTFDRPGTYRVTLTVTDSNSNVTIGRTVDGAESITIVVTEPQSASIPAWMWIWGSTGVIIVAVGAVGFVMMRRKM